MAEASESGNETIFLNDETEVLDELLQGTSHPVLGNEIVPLTSETQIALPSTGDGSLVAPTQSEGNEIVPFTSDTQIALPSTGDGSLVAPAQSEVVIAGGNYVGAVIGPQTNKKVLKANDYRNAKITNIHHHHYPAKERSQSQESPSTSIATGARPKQRPKPASQEDVVQISDDLFMYSNQPLQEGTDVYKGYQLHASGDRRPLAIKRIVPCEDSHLTEVQHLLTLASHPNVIQIIQSKQHDGIVRVLFIAMELCSSQNLQGYLDKNREENAPFDFDQTMSFTKQLVSGMKHIHVNKIVHRDVKPENILVSEDGEHIKVSDFGLSKRLRLGKSQTRQTKLGAGTDGYRAPETFVSETIGSSADIFSLGAVIYSMWSNGNHPFGSNVYLLNNNIINNEGRDLSGLLISGTKETQLRNLIDGMLHPDPTKRPTIEQVVRHPFFKSGPSSTAEDNRNRASSSEQTVEKSSPQRPNNNLPAEHPIPTPRLSAATATQNNSTKKDPSNNASSKQQRGLKPSSLRKPSNEDTLTERSRSILHHPSAENIPHSTPDPSNNASSSQQRGMKPSSLRKPTNEDTLTELSRSILHHPSAANIPPPTPDPKNRSNLRQQPVEESSPKRPANVKTLSERFRSAIGLPSAPKKVSSKEDPNNRSNLRQLPVEEASTKRSTNETTLPERFQSALRIPSTSKQVPFKEGIVIFDWFSEHLQLFNPADNTLKQMQSFNEDMKNYTYTAVTLHDFVYALMWDRSVHRLKFSDERATWKRMPDMIDDHGSWPPATVMSGSIYVAGGSGGDCFFPTYTNAVEKFDPSSNKWSSLKEKEMITRDNALVVAQGLIYSIGGYSNEKVVLKDVERFDPDSSTWTFVAPMKQARFVHAAVEFNGKIFVLGGYGEWSGGGVALSSVEIYDPSANVWSVMRNNMLKPRYYFSAFVINGDIYAVGGVAENGVERYSSEKDVWEEVLIQTKRAIWFCASTKIQI